MDWSQADGGTENGKRDLNFFPRLLLLPIFILELSRGRSGISTLQLQIRLLSYRHHESAARYRRTKHSDVEGQEIDQKPGCCQRVPFIVAAISLTVTL